MKTAGELASQGRDVGQTADKELKQAGDQAADQVMAVLVCLCGGTFQHIEHQDSLQSSHQICLQLVVHQALYLQQLMQHAES